MRGSRASSTPLARSVEKARRPADPPASPSLDSAAQNHVPLRRRPLAMQGRSVPFIRIQKWDPSLSKHGDGRACVRIYG